MTTHLLLGALLGLVVGVATLLVLGLCWAASREPEGKIR